MTKIRVVSWNLRYGRRRAERQGAVLSSLDPAPDVAFLQEAKQSSLQDLRKVAGLDWAYHALEFGGLPEGRTEAHRPCVALAGRGPRPSRVEPLLGIPLPEKVLTAHVDIGGEEVFIASYHAPPGVTWKYKKVQQALAFAHRVCRVRGPSLFGADANTPAIDHPDLESLQVHWPTGRADLGGWPGDDVLFGPDPIHPCRDALRGWLDQHPEKMAEVRAANAEGPLAISHYTGKRKGFAGTPRRYDAIWVSPEFEVESVRYDFGEEVTACSDHALVVADLELRATRASEPA